ncbi:MAG: beta-ketoacyl-ACP synthase III [Propionibacteriales bacterium]|nr:beta-ketoacyl-ACP synthase III [Propionibacteriales bacterium]
MTTAIQQATGAAHTGLLGLGVYRPSRRITNAEICENIDSTDEWIRTRSGIIERRWADEGETVVSMAVASAKEALDHAGVAPQQIGCVLVATVTHMLQTPAAAPLVATELGAFPAAAFDISAACAGFCYGVGLASDMVRAGTAKYVLVIGVERLSDITDPHDRTTAFLFADGAGAVVVGPTDEPGIGPVVWGSDGEKFDLIAQKEDWRDVVQAERAFMPHLRMDGNPVFRWASFAMAKVGREALDVAGITPDELRAFIPHQANMRIVDAMARTLRLSDHVAIARDIAYQGNTSAASIPLAMDRLLVDGESRSGDTALLIAFGAGLTYAAQVVKIP